MNDRPAQHGEQARRDFRSSDQSADRRQKLRPRDEPFIAADQPQDRLADCSAAFQCRPKQGERSGSSWRRFVSSPSATTSPRRRADPGVGVQEPPQAPRSGSTVCSGSLRKPEEAGELQATPPRAGRQVGRHESARRSLPARPDRARTRNPNSRSLPTSIMASGWRAKNRPLKNEPSNASSTAAALPVVPPSSAASTGVKQHVALERPPRVEDREAASASGSASRCFSAG